MEIEPIDPQFEAEVAHLAGRQRKGESAVDHMRRIARIRQLMRLEQRDGGFCYCPAKITAHRHLGSGRETTIGEQVEQSQAYARRAYGSDTAQ